MADTVAPTTENTQYKTLAPVNQDLGQFDTSVFQGSQPPAANPYANTSTDYGVYQAYVNNVGRAPENSTVLKQWGTDPNYATDIANTPEAQTLGRARNEVNPLVDAELQNYLSQGNIARQSTANQLGALDPAYNQKYAALQFGLGDQQQTIAHQLDDMSQNYDVNYGRLNQSLSQIPLKAFQMANRRGLLDSSIAYDTLGQLATPVQQSLADLTRSYGSNRSAAQAKLQSIQQKYDIDYQNMVSQREQDAKALRDALMTQLQGIQSQAAQTQATRGAKIYARAGDLGDALKQYQLQSRTLDSSINSDAANRAEQARQFNARMALAQQLGKSI